MPPDSAAMATVRDQSPRKARSRRKLLIKSVVSIVLIGFILSRIEVGHTLAVLRSANFGLLALAFLLTFAGACLTSARWRVLLAAQDVRATLPHLIACWLTAGFFNQFLPSTIGGDAIRIYDSWKLGATRGGAVAAIMLDRLLGLFALMIFGVIALYISSLLVDQHPGIRVLVVGCALGLALIAAWIFWPSSLVDRLIRRAVSLLPGKLQRLAIGFHDALMVYQGRGLVLVKAMALSFALQLNVILYYFLIGQALGLPLGFLDYMLVIPVASIVLLLPFTINGVGLREGIFVLLLGAFGVPAASAVAFAWAAFLLFLMYGLIGGIVYALRGEVVRDVGESNADRDVPGSQL